jgi:hypothetical protein
MSLRVRVALCLAVAASGAATSGVAVAAPVREDPPAAAARAVPEVTPPPATDSGVDAAADRAARETRAKRLVAGGLRSGQARRVAAAGEWSAIAVERLGAVSRIGGPPVLPPGRVWPRRTGRPLTFVALIDLREIPVFPGRETLPADGSLLVFADLDAQEYEPAANRPGGVGRLYHVPLGTPLVAAKRPKASRPMPKWATRARVRPIPVGFVPWLGPPSWEDPALARLGPTSERAVERWDLTAPGAAGGGRGTGLRLLGVPWVTQTDPREDGDVSLVNLDPAGFGVDYLDLGSITFLGRPADIARGDWSGVRMGSDSH